MAVQVRIHPRYGALTYRKEQCRYAPTRRSVSNRRTSFTLPNGLVTESAYAAASRLGSLPLTYDLNRNLTSDGVNTYTGNARNQLISINGGSVTASFTYDAIGRR